MDPIRNTQQFKEMRIVRMIQEIRVIAVCDTYPEPGLTEAPTEEWIVVDSLQRPLPIPYNEAQ